MNDDLQSDPSWYRFGLLFEAGLAVVAIVLGMILGVPAWGTLHWSVRDLGLGAAGTIPLLAMFAYACQSPRRELVRIRELVHLILLPLVRGRSLFAIALLALAAGVGEEMLFRGVLQGWLATRFSVATAILASSIVFGLLHWITPTYGIIAFFISVFLGWFWHVNGNLLSVITTHALYDFLALLYLLRLDQPLPEAAAD